MEPPYSPPLVTEQGSPTSESTQVRLYGKASKTGMAKDYFPFSCRNLYIHIPVSMYLYINMWPKLSMNLSLVLSFYFYMLFVSYQCTRNSWGGAAIIPQNYADVLPGTRHNFYLGLREFLDE